MTKLLGIIILLLGVVFGVYVGGYIFFFKGIVIVIEQIKAPIIDSPLLAWGIVKIVSASLVGIFSALVPCAIGASMIDGK